VRFRVYDYLVSTNKPTGGKEYQRLEDALDRLRGTSIKTNIKTGGQRVKEGFGIVDSWTIIEKAPDDDRMIAVEVTLSKWLFNALHAVAHPHAVRLRLLACAPVQDFLPLAPPHRRVGARSVDL